MAPSGTHSNSPVRKEAGNTPIDAAWHKKYQMQKAVGVRDHLSASDGTAIVNDGENDDLTPLSN